MASIHQDPKSGRYRIRFRLHEQEFNRSLKTKIAKDARAILGRVNETLALIERGRLEIPADAELGRFVLSDGKISKKTSGKTKSKSVKNLFLAYENSQFHKAKEQATQKTEQVHLRHLRRLLKLSTPIRTIRVATIQEYVDSRLFEKTNGKNILPDTVKNEIVTFRLIWNWAVQQELIDSPCPTRGVSFPLRDEKPPFMTRSEIERKIARGGMDDKQIAALWESLYLSKSEISEILKIAKGKYENHFLYPMLITAAYTGARRSELLRSEIDDFKFDSNSIHLREKKKSRSKAITFRIVPMTPKLRQSLIDWFENHPGGQYAFAQQNGSPVSVDSARHFFERTFKKTRWSVLRGYHVFRHSFCSNCATAGVDQRLINEWVGHQTEEMVKRYRHLFPEKQQQAINQVFGE